MAGTVEEVIVAGLEQIKPAKTGLVDLIFGGAISMTYPTKKIDVDMYDGTRGTAGYSARGAKGQTVGIEGWTTEQHQPPMINENIVITAEDLEVREFGKGNINNEARSEAKFQKIVNRQIQRLENRKQRAYTEQVRDLIVSGAITVSEKDDKGAVLASRVIDFKMPSAHIYTVATAWNSGTQDIFADMKAIDELIIKASGLTPDYAVVGTLTLSDMIADAKIQKLLDNRRIEFGNLVKEDRGNGITFWGKLDGKEIYTFTDFDDAGNPIIPVSAYIVGSSMAELDIMYASLTAMVNNKPAIVEAEMVMQDILDVEAVAIKKAFKSAKLYALTQSGAFGHLTTR